MNPRLRINSPLYNHFTTDQCKKEIEFRLPESFSTLVSTVCTTFRTRGREWLDSNQQQFDFQSIFKVLEVTEISRLSLSIVPCKALESFPSDFQSGTLPSTLTGYKLKDIELTSTVFFLLRALPLSYSNLLIFSRGWTRTNNHELNRLFEVTVNFRLYL